MFDWLDLEFKNYGFQSIRGLVFFRGCLRSYFPYQLLLDTAPQAWGNQTQSPPGLGDLGGFQTIFDTFKTYS